MKLKDFMTPNPITVRPDDRLYRAMQIMAWTEVRHLPVTVTEGSLVGVLSERDILALRASSPEIDAKSTLISEAMRSAIPTAAPDSDLTEAAARFAQSRISCLPVTEKGKIVGLVTKTDLLAAEVALAMTAVGAPLCAGDVMTRAPQPVGPDEEVDYAMELMAEMGIRHLPVIDDAGRTVGILDDHDALRAYRGRGRLTHELSEGASEELLVQDVMSKRPISVSLDETCTSIAHLFLQYRATAALVHDSEGTLAGIVSYVDLLKWMIPKATLMGAHPG